MNYHTLKLKSKLTDSRIWFARTIWNKNVSKTALLYKAIFLFCVILFVLLSISTYYFISYTSTKIILPTDRFEIARNDPSEFTFEVLEELERIHYIDVEYDEIPIDCINAIVAIEDKTFWTNHGIDRNGTARLFLSTIPGVNYGGGSTISQQVIKMTTDQYYNRNPLDKLKEMIWGFRLNYSFSKEEILEKYLNNLYFGKYNYGVQAASLDYFGKSISELDLDECAYLMGIPQSPNNYIPSIENHANGEARMNQVLEAMRREDYIE